MKIVGATIALLAFSASAALAQTAAPTNPLRRSPAAARPAATEPAQPAQPSAQPAVRSRGKTPGDFAERRRRCSGEWRAAKAANTTGGQKWPQFFSACNTRLKAAGV